MLGTIIEAIRLIRDAWPRRWSNVESRFVVDELGMAFSSRGKGRAVLAVTILDMSGRMIAYLEGAHRHDGDVEIGCNLDAHSHALLVECFRMAYCYREFERTGDLDRSKHFQHFRTRAVFRRECEREAEASWAESNQA
jgi:hypothetical protein